MVISFIDLYPKVRRNFPEAREVPREQRLSLGKKIIEIASAHGMTVKPCAEGDDLAVYGADCGGCMRISDYEKAIGKIQGQERQVRHLPPRDLIVGASRKTAAGSAFLPFLPQKPSMGLNVNTKFCYFKQLNIKYITFQRKIFSKKRAKRHCQFKKSIYFCTPFQRRKGGKMSQTFFYIMPV